MPVWGTKRLNAHRSKDRLIQAVFIHTVRGCKGSGNATTLQPGDCKDTGPNYRPLALMFDYVTTYAGPRVKISIHSSPEDSTRKDRATC